MSNIDKRSAPWALAALSSAILLASLDTSIANVALPTLANAFRASFQQVQWVVLSYLLAITTVIVSVGRLGDVIGRKRLFLIGVALFTVASAACGAAPTLPLLLAARAVQGLVAAIMTALTLAFVSDTVPKEKTGSAMGLLGATSAVGTALGPSLGGLLIASIGWRSIFFINLPIGIATVLIASRHLPRDAQRAGAVRFDVRGTLLLAATLGAYALAMTLGRGHFGAMNVGLVVAAIIGAALFVRVETTAASPLVRLAMLREPVLSGGLAMSALVVTVVMATLVAGPFYLTTALALGAAQVGLVMSCGPIVAALTSIPAGRIVDRFGSQRATMTGLAAMLFGATLLALLPARLGIAGYVVPLAILTSGYALFQAANNTAVMSGVRADQRGVVSGMLNLARNLGLITGAAMMGAVFALASAASGLPQRAAAAAFGMHATFAVAALLLVVAVSVSLVSRGSHQAGEAPAVHAHAALRSES